MFFLSASKIQSTLDQERLDTGEGFEIIEHSDTLQDLLGYVYTMIQLRDPEFYTLRHARIVDAEGMEHYLFLRYDWEPQDNWVQQNPLPSCLEGYVTAPGVHYRPNTHKLVQAYMLANNMVYSVSGDPCCTPETLTPQYPASQVED